MRSIKLPSWINRALGAGARSTPPNVFAIDGDVLSFARFNTASSDALRIEESRGWQVPPEVLGKGPIGGPIRDQATLDAFIQEVVSELGEPVQDASLVLPDDWSRAVFLEVAELPRNERSRDEVLRWKLKQQVPFRVEDLRIRGVVVRPLVEQEEPQRVLATFGSEHLLSGLEQAFQRAGVRIGHLGNHSVAFAEGVSANDGGEAFLWGSISGYSLIVLDRGEPVLLRSKSLEEGLNAQVVASMVERELRLTLGFLAKRLPDVTLQRIVVGDSDPATDWVEAAQRGVNSMVGKVEGALPGVSSAAEATRGRFELGDAKALAWLPLFGAAQRAVA